MCTGQEAAFSSSNQPPVCGPTCMRTRPAMRPYPGSAATGYEDGVRVPAEDDLLQATRASTERNREDAGAVSVRGAVRVRGASVYMRAGLRWPLLGALRRRRLGGWVGTTPPCWRNMDMCYGGA